MSDLVEATQRLAVATEPANKYEVSEAAAWTLLSRVYLFMERYGDAIEAAGNVKSYHLYNIADTYVAGSGNSFLTTANPELIYGQGTSGDLHEGTYRQIQTTSGRPPVTVTETVPSAKSYSCSDELSALFNADDARYSAFFARSFTISNRRLKGQNPEQFSLNLLVNRKYRREFPVGAEEKDPVTGATVPVNTAGSGISGEASIRYAEVILNKAEAEACLGSGDAVATITEFCRTRYNVMPAIPAGGSELIEFIRRERQKELCFEGHRWFDLRRYAVNSVHAQSLSIRHVLHTAQDNATAPATGESVIAAYTDAIYGVWQLPVTEDVIDYCYPHLSNPAHSAGVTQTEY